MESKGNGAALKAFESCENQVTASTVEQVQAAYSSCAANYDHEAIDLGVRVQREAALVCLNHIKNCKASSILDVAAGTGAVAFYLRKTGHFVGSIDITDANMEMLYVASKKELDIRTISCHWIDEDLPFRENSYDAVTCIGALFPNHLPMQSVKVCVVYCRKRKIEVKSMGMLKVVKRGGFLIFNLRNRHAGDDIYIGELQEMVDEWIREKVLELVEVKELLHLGNVDDLLTQLYVYRKL